MYVNGLTGTNLYVESLNKTRKVRPYCANHVTERYQIWPNPSGLLPGKIHCTFDNLKLEWDDATKQYKDRGVVIKPDLSRQGSGSWAGWEYVLNHTFGYNHENTDICGYDWRLGPRQWKSNGGAFELCTQRLEQLYKANGNRKVMLTSISMGGPFTKIWLETQSQEWKDRYIEGWISLSGVFGGAVELLQGQLRGDPGYQGTAGFTAFGHLFTWLNLREFSDTTEDWAGQVVLLPFQVGDKQEDSRTIVSTPSKSYTSADIRQLLIDAGRTEHGIQVYEDVMPMQMTQTHPGVPFWCYIGTNLKTVEALKYDARWDQPNADHDTVSQYGNGDATVHAASLEACTRWSHPKYPTHIKHFHQIAHAPMLFSYPALWEALLDISSVTIGDPLGQLGLRDHQTPNVTYA